MQEIKNIIFDLGGVILNIDFKKTETAFINLGIENFGELFAHNQVSGLFKDYEKGIMDDRAFVAALQELAGHHLTEQQVTDAWNALLLDFPRERIYFLKELRKKYRLFLFSNTNAIHLQALREKYSAVFAGSFDDLFEKAYYSHLIGLRKPDIAAFNYVINDSHLDAGSTFFIDDSLANVAGAAETGLRAIYLEPGASITEIGL